MNYKELDTDFVNIETTRKLQADIPVSRLLNALQAYERRPGSRDHANLSHRRAIILHSDGTCALSSYEGGFTILRRKTVAELVEFLETEAGLRT